jgi:hypothetical protein
MDLLSLYASLQNLRLGFREVPPYWDRDLRELYEARLQEHQQNARRSGPPARPRRTR